MRYSNNYNIPLPEGNNDVKIQDLTDGLEIIDTELKLINDAPKTPVGAAGGDLQGTYPNPTIKTVPVSKGGTSATNTADALANLGGEPLIKNAFDGATLTDICSIPYTEAGNTMKLSWPKFKAMLDKLYGNVADITCSTAAGTVAKIGTIQTLVSQPAFSQRMGTMAIVFFQNGNTVANATLNVASQGAYPLYNPHNNTSNVPLPPNFRAFCVLEIDNNGNGYWFVLNAPTPSTSITVNNTLTSTSTTEALSANQGRALNELFRGSSIPKNGLVAEYLFNDMTGNVITDTSGNNRHLTCWSSFTRRPGKRGYGLGVISNRGAGDFGDSWVNSLFTPNFSWSISFWLTAIPYTDVMGLFGGQSSVDTWMGGSRLFLGWDPANADNSTSHGICYGSHGWNYTCYKASFADLESPVGHWVITGNSASNIRTYLNGKFYKTLTHYSGTYSSSTTPPRNFGIIMRQASTQTAESYLKPINNVDMIRVYNRPLDDEEILHLYNLDK